MGVSVPNRCRPADVAAAGQFEVDGCPVVAAAAAAEAAAAADMCDKKCGCGVTGEFMLGNRSSISGVFWRET